MHVDRDGAAATGETTPTGRAPVTARAGPGIAAMLCLGLAMAVVSQAPGAEGVAVVRANSAPAAVMAGPEVDQEIAVDLAAVLAEWPARTMKTEPTPTSSVRLAQSQKWEDLRADSALSARQPAAVLALVPGGVSRRREAANLDLPLVWSSRFAEGLADWTLLGSGWGLENRSFGPDRAIQGQAFRVFVPAGSIDPATMKARGLPYGGTGFKAVVAAGGLQRAILKYKVRFPLDFEPARGGKLPGLCGGACNGAGNIPNGTDGFSARYMWLPAMGGEAYAYLPTSVIYGTGMTFVGASFPLGRWVVLTQELKLNTPGAANGWIKVWLDGQLVLNQRGLTFRNTDALAIDRLYFDVFYGGNDDTWAAPKDTVIEFAEFEVYGIR